MSFRHANDLVTGNEVLVPEKSELVPTKVVKVVSLIMKGSFVYHSVCY